MIDKTSFDYSDFANYLGISESTSNYSTNTGNGAYGKYQFLPGTIQEVANYLGVSNPDLNTFLLTPTLQEQFYQGFVSLIIDTLNNQNMDSLYDGSSITGASNGITTTINQYGLVGGGWLGGQNAPYNLLVLGNDPADSNGTHVSDYIAKFSADFNSATKKSSSPVVTTSFNSDVTALISFITIELNNISKSYSALNSALLNFKKKYGK